jgi:hypothetical protein
MADLSQHYSCCHSAAGNFYRTLALFALCSLLLASCGENDGDDDIPIAPVNITLDPNSTIYQELNVPGGWMYLDESDGVVPPSRGIIVYRLTNEEFLAFERTPPYKPDSCCPPAGMVCSRLLVEEYYPFVADTCTHSTFLILDGTPVSGPANRSLWQYYADYDGYVLFIHD